MYHSMSIQEVLQRTETSLTGLQDHDALERRKQFGENKLKREQHTSLLRIFFRQFQDVVIYILILATIVSFLVHEYLDAYVILGILIFNAVLGFIQEYKAERAIMLLRKLTTLKVRAIRNDVIVNIPSDELVPGDIVILEAGDKVPADIRIVEAKQLQTNEASLTGESLPCSKQTKAIHEKIVLAERNNMLYAGTIVARGIGKGIVVETGMHTEIGKIASMVQQVKEQPTPLQKKLKQVGKYLGLLVIGICAVVFLVGYFKQMDLILIFLTAISLAVAAIPEGLPAVVTVCLALSVQHMIKHNVLIKKLKSIETLGSVTVICSDKTGTLTKNEMTVRKLLTNNKIFNVTGYGYNSGGAFYDAKGQIDPENIHKLLEIAISCNNATETIGDPTEIALLYAAQKGHVERLKKDDEIPFDSDQKYMATMHGNATYYKGAVEKILPMCNAIYIDGKVRRLIKRDLTKIDEVNQSFASEALRVLAMAYKQGNKFIFVGLMGMIDPPKEGVKEALLLCDDAGIRSVMITGDHPITAQAIAKQIGLTGNVMTGVELDDINDEQLKDIVNKYDIYARTSSAHKVRILSSLQTNGHVVAMTGDGINDAPALKKADVGVAMSQKGTDVSRDVSDMVLVDDHFASIVKAIKEGRIVYDNIKKFVNYLLSANTAEIGIILFGLLLGLPLPLLPIQILWVNLMTDSWPALALGLNRAEGNVMKRQARHPKESIFKNLKGQLILTGILGTVIVLGIFAYSYFTTNDVAQARTLALTTLIMFELFRVYSCKNARAFGILFDNKWLNCAVLLSFGLQLLILYTPLNIAFKVVPLGLFEWLPVIILGSLGFFGLELWKKMTQGRRHVY